MVQVLVWACVQALALALVSALVQALVLAVKKDSVLDGPDCQVVEALLHVQDPAYAAGNDGACALHAAAAAADGVVAAAVAAVAGTGQDLSGRTAAKEGCWVLDLLLAAHPYH